MTIPSLIGGKDELASSTFDVTDPSTGEVCWNVSSISEQDARRVADTAHAAFPAWAATKPLERQAILFKAADLMEERANELVTYMHIEMGIDGPMARGLIVGLGITMMRDIACRIGDVYGTVPKLGLDGQSTMVWKEPYGVILGIVPWNAPYVFGVRAAATAIATGNTAILKSSEMTPRCYWALGRVFHDSGVPAGVVNVVCCRRDDAASIVNAMIEHPAVKKVNFTGSANVGRKISQHCGLHLKPTLMELGGKNSAIILPDADLQKAAQWCLIGAFANSGQICMATDTIQIHKDVAPEFLQILKQTITAMQASSDSLPVVVSTTAVSRIAALIEDATKKGGEIFHGGLPPPSEKTAHVIPTVIGGVSDNMSLWMEEAFGPLVGYRTFLDEDDVVKVVNGTGYGLSASVWTRDLRKAFALAKRLDAGQVHINSMTINGAEGVPFGGMNNSGWGRFNAKEGMEEFIRTKTVTWDD